MLVIKGLNSNWNGSSGAAEGKEIELPLQLLSNLLYPQHI